MLIQRYKAVINDKPYKPYAYNEKCDEGNMVLYSDHAAEVDRLNEQVRALAAAHDRMTFVLLREGIEVAGPTPEEVAAFMRDVRAEAVEEFGIYHNYSDKKLIQFEAKKYAARIRKSGM